ncbi:MAG: CinA family protein, partial [Moorea sp. SIO4G2]|nr:CinA family protein [Moorena sp. SIO4G2]
MDRIQGLAPLDFSVKKGDVYTETTARQMAAGALKNSRAMVSIAVTGHAGPVDKDELEDLGVVNAAVSIRTTSESQDSDIQEQP